MQPQQHVDIEAGEQSPTEQGPGGPVPLLLRVAEAARLLSLSRTTVYLLLESGQLPSIKCGTARRIPRAALDEWIARQLQEG